MKKILVLLACLFIIPIGVNASSFAQKDISINIDDNKWYVFTRDNISNNDELSELGLTYEYLKDFMNKNDIYIDAGLFDENDESNTIELFVAIKPVENVNNLHKYSNDEINELGDELLKLTGATKFDIIENNYKYVYLEYQDSGYNILEYYTVINGSGYTVMTQKVNAYTDADKQEIKSIVDSVSFKIDDAYEKEITKNKFDWTNVIIYAVIGGIIGGVVGLINKKKKHTTN